MHNKTYQLFLLSIVLLLLAGCNTPEPTATPISEVSNAEIVEEATEVATETAVPEPTATETLIPPTPIPTETNTPQPTATATATSTATASPTPLPTETPIPTDTPIPPATATLAPTVPPPTATTAAPPPPAPPVVAFRPQPIPFDGVGLRDNMTYMRSQIEQMGGVLDRLFNGEDGRCSEYQEYYANITRSATYHSIPDAWHGAYNEYIFAVESALATSIPINDLCNNGGGVVTPLNYGAARQGINTSLDRLIPAIDLANGLLGG